MEMLGRDLICIGNTSIFGEIKEINQVFDEEKILGQYLINYKLHKIICYYEKNVGISGLQVYYTERMTSQEVKTIDIIKKNIPDNIEEQELILESNEIINKITIYIFEQFRGFEVITNKNNKRKFGWCEIINNDEKTKADLLEFDGSNCLLGFFGSFNKIEGITGLGFYYINTKFYHLFAYYGFFLLRIKLKKEEFKEKTLKNINKMKYSDKVLFKACCLPNNPFFEIIKYILF